MLVANSYSQIYPTPLAITSQRCQIQNFNITFPNVQYGNPWEAPPIGYGTITNYEYLLPVGWKLNNGPASNGTAWQVGNNSATVTSDLLNGGSGTNIRIRPINTACGIGLSAWQEATVSISRPTANLSIIGSNDLCTGSNNYTVNGLPTGATVTWTATNPAAATITTSGNTCSVTKVGNGLVTLTATAIINGSCTAGTASKTIRVGYNYINANVSGETTVYANSGYGYTLLTNPTSVTISNIVWIVPTGWSIVYGQGSNFINVWTGTTGGAVEVYFDDACGIRTSRYITVGVGSGGGIAQRLAPQNTKENVVLKKSFSENPDTEQKFENGIIIYPNPAKANLNILISNEVMNKNIEIVDATGKIVQKFFLKAIQNSVNISNLPKGLYMMRIIGENKGRSLKFIKE